MDGKKFQTVDEYISTFPESTRHKLTQIRKAVKKSAPQAEELIGYNMPAFKLMGPLVYFAGYTGHIGFYPGPSGIESFKKELSVYKGAKGSVQFPIDEPLPLDLISRIVSYRVKENIAKNDLKKTKRKSK